MTNEVQIKPNLDDVLFAVVLWEVIAAPLSLPVADLFAEVLGNDATSEARWSPIRATSFKAIVDLERQRVLAVVTLGYKLVTNKEAIERGKAVFRQVFSQSTVDTMELYNVVTPKTRSFCHVDFTLQGYKFSLDQSDEWIPFLRITNSYNRMKPLRFDLGFCRAICKNGMIFGAEAIAVKRYHTRSQMKADPLAGIDLSAIKKTEAEFLEKLRNLKRYAVPPNIMLPLTCKVFDFRFTQEQLATKNTHERARKLGSQIKQLTDKYFEELGHNGYAAFNVLTDFASRPEGVGSSPVSRIHSLQTQSGTWIDEFIQAIEQRTFNFQEYVKDYAPTASRIGEILSA